MLPHGDDRDVDGDHDGWAAVFVGVDDEVGQDAFEAAPVGLRPSVPDEADLGGRCGGPYRGFGRRPQFVARPACSARATNREISSRSSVSPRRLGPGRAPSRPGGSSSAAECSRGCRQVAITSSAVVTAAASVLGALGAPGADVVHPRVQITGTDAPGTQAMWCRGRG
ncbi:hypothetical protein ADK86_07605 [Streptomyces sp. NRRL F-5755]|nr:hypothetical protein ADK86_07605 [Streptomyces sp. NRRL F-5755]